MYSKIMITILSIICSLIVTMIIGITIMNIFDVSGAILGLIAVLLSSFFGIEFYRLLCTIL